MSALLVVDLKKSRGMEALLVSIGIATTFLVSLGRIWLIFFLILVIGIDLGLATRTFFAFSLYVSWIAIFKVAILRK